MVARLDLHDFFRRSARTLQAVFRAAGIRIELRHLLAGICTNATPLDVWDDCSLPASSAEARTSPLAMRSLTCRKGRRLRRRWRICRLPLDCRLTGLATAAGATYTRYADDLAFSGEAEFARSVKRFCLHACAVAMEEGFQFTIARRGSCGAVFGSDWRA